VSNLTRNCIMWGVSMSLFKVLKHNCKMSDNLRAAKVYFFFPNKY
jgi:hypothetical protein